MPRGRSPGGKLNGSDAAMLATGQRGGTPRPPDGRVPAWPARPPRRRRARRRSPPRAPASAPAPCPRTGSAPAPAGERPPCCRHTRGGRTVAGTRSRPAWDVHRPVDTHAVEDRAEERIRDHGLVEAPHEQLDLGFGCQLGPFGDRARCAHQALIRASTAGNSTLLSLWMCRCVSASNASSPALKRSVTVANVRSPVRSSRR